MATKETAKSVQHIEPGRRPEVIVEFLFDHGLLFISVNNIGDRGAVNVSVKFDQKIIGLGGSKDISQLPLFRSLQFLGPKREIVTFVDSSASYFGSKQPAHITARISYQDSDSRQYNDIIRHNLEVFRDLIYLDQNQTDNYPKAEV
ncbi:MAG TPA: hypothetical protein VJV03_05115 [Pyrinomonadaceae bacterium]|nr:hypothetical protein [Pyrinomonadaceae bacterium]